VALFVAIAYGWGSLRDILAAVGLALAVVDRMGSVWGWAWGASWFLSDDLTYVTLLCMHGGTDWGLSVTDVWVRAGTWVARA
jgi:hypothetical protein